MRCTGTGAWNAVLLALVGTVPAVAQGPCWDFRQPMHPPATYAPAPVPYTPPPTPAPCLPAPPPSTAPTPTEPGKPEPTRPDAGAAAAPSTDSFSSPGDTGTTGGESLSLLDSSVGYLDNAIPGNQLRLRYDDAFRSNRPNRAEFFYARGQPFGPGLPEPETNVDYQDFTFYLETGLGERFSVFAEGLLRALNPTINANTIGMGDMQCGFKWAWIYTDTTVGTFQLKTYEPTGDADRGLGTHHFSIEPGWLMYTELLDQFQLSGEVRYWVPIGGTPGFEGDVIRYGLGIGFGLPETDSWWYVPIFEAVGWTVLDGQETVAFSATDFFVKSASGDTIVNAKIGLRVGFREVGDFYAGYGRALTGAVWYKDDFRLEFRLFY